MVSITYAVCVWPTERHHSGLTGSGTECSWPFIIGSLYEVGDTPSTEVGSMPSFIIISIGVPATIDWPTTECSQPTTAPCASSVAFTACTYIGR